jgi:cytochrome c1
VATEPESSAAPGALAPRPEQELAEPRVALSGGAGLFDHSDRDAVGRGGAAIAGILGIVVACGIAVVFVTMNPSFASGAAGGSPNQLGNVQSGGAPVIEPGSPAAEGQQIIASKPCVGCHTIPGIPGANGTVGPNLGGVASRTKIAGGAVNNNGPDDLKKWIMNPPAEKPGTLMPNLGLTDDEATKIVAYLETLK